ncbi:MAG: DUF1631 family protein [Rubrivivax sp.]|nr:DUF1631 family protein [Rubrivivax sp.]
MAVRPSSSALQQYVEDELLRAPLLFDQVIDGANESARRDLAMMAPAQRSTVGDLMQALLAQRARLGDYFMRSLREQVEGDLARRDPPGAPRQSKRMSLSLVDEEEVAMDVELSHTIEAIKSTAEYELRELQTYISSLVGDMDVSTDHNPFRPESYARAVWAAAQALPLSRGHQLAFMRHAGLPLAQLLRKTYAASASRLESLGVEPAIHRTVILPSGQRRGGSGRANETTYTPDLHRMVETMPAPLDDAKLSYEGQDKPRSPRGAPRQESWRDVARHTSNRIDRQSIELVSRLFDAMVADERVPPDVGQIIARMQGPAMRLVLRDGGGLLDHDKHPLWRFINLLVFEAEMAPDPVDPDRLMLLKNALAIVEQLASEHEQNNGLYRWALERLDGFLQKRLTRRLTAAASQIGALQKLEDQLFSGRPLPSGFHGTMDVADIDTVPAELLDDESMATRSPALPGDWTDTLKPGDWVRMFMQGRWVQARLLWPGERREVWLFGDGASDATWAIRRGALANMHKERLAKTLRQRSIVGSAAARVQDQMAGAAA